MTSPMDVFAQRVWVALREIDSRRTTFVGKIEQASASDADASGGPALPRVMVSGIDVNRILPVHPTLVLDDQIRALGSQAVGMKVVVQLIGNQLCGMTIQLTGETRW